MMTLLDALYGLFVDDELLAIGIIAAVGLSAALIGAGIAPLAAGAVLLVGNLLVLVAGALRTAWRKAP